MPKTNEKDAYYFPHDCNARNDPKILALRSIFGAEGYGVYFMLIEILREQPDYKLQINKYLYHTLAMQMQMQKERLQEIVDACCNEFAEGDRPLLVNDGEYLYSASLLRRMDKVDDISKLRREAAQKRWRNQACKDSGGDDSCKSDANAELEQSKEKQSRAKQSRAEKSKADIFAAYAGGDAELLSALRGFEEMRVKIKKPMTDRARKLMLAELEKLSMDRNVQIAILNQSTGRSWAGVFALKEGPYRSGRPEQATGGEKMDALRDLHDVFSGRDQP